VAAATVTCPSCGAQSTTTDYCDNCGAALSQSPGSATAAPATSGGGPSAATPSSSSSKGTPAGAGSPASVCPNCGANRTPDDVFCEVCGLDFASGKLPAAPAMPASATTPPSPTAVPAGTPSGWSAVIEADRAMFDSNQAETPGSTIAFPDGVAAREVALAGDEVLIGRRSDAKGLFPVIDLGGPAADPGVSHRHALLRRQPDGSWAVLDEASSNGTYVNDDDRPIDHGVLTALHDGDRIHIGAFTTITIRRDAPAPAPSP